MNGDLGAMTSNPFAVVSFIAAPALLTNASSVLAMSTINRMLRTHDRMQELYVESEKGGMSDSDEAALLARVDRVERQATVLLAALRSIYVALGAFAAATFVTLLGAGLQPYQDAAWFRAVIAAGLVLGLVGVGGLVFGSVRLFEATRLSLVGIREQSARIRARHAVSSERNRHAV